jgi:phosphoglycerol transferase MdoB-like AlkP superfamily enzyme
MIRGFLTVLLKVMIFWMVFFAIHRLLFVLFNSSFAASSSALQLLTAFGVGIRLDLSVIGYISLLIIVLQVLSLSITRKFCLKCIDYLSFTLIVAFSFILVSSANLYSYWGKHLDGEALDFLKTPGVIIDSLKWYEAPLLVLVGLLFSLMFVGLYKKGVVAKPAFHQVWQVSYTSGAKLLFLLLLAGFMIIPIRGGIGIAPINTGAAFFSDNLFVNHTAINPVWNLGFSMKGVDVRKKSYRFMDDDKANEIFDQLMDESGTCPNVLNVERPNIVIILLESFSAQVIGALGGEPVSPNLDRLITEGLLFNNLMAASDRSDKGLVATLSGYQVMPKYSIIQFPNKSQSLGFLPKSLKNGGYNDMTFIYGGDIGFKNMNSFVIQSGFEKSITQDDFSSKLRGKKWGVHDEHTFDRLLQEMKSSQAPFFKFFFTLSSHEPFDVPGPMRHQDPYLNSIAYTDSCLGQFFDHVKTSGLWENTLFILLADHSVVGPGKATHVDIARFHIPMLWTGGAVSARDTVISKPGSQTDLARTLLCQLKLDEPQNYPFSKNLLDDKNPGFAFYCFNDGFGYLSTTVFQVFNNQTGKFMFYQGHNNDADSLNGKAYLQKVSMDHKLR